MSVRYQQVTDQGEEVASPCVRNCCLNEVDICLGCFRHLDEIMAWQKLNGAAKKDVLRLCQQRQQQQKNLT